MRKNRIKDSEWIFFGPNRGKLVKISFWAEGFFFSQKKWGTNKIEYVCICHGHPWVSGRNSIPTLPNYHLPLVRSCKFFFQVLYCNPIKGCLPSKVVFRQRSSSVKGLCMFLRLPYFKYLENIKCLFICFPIPYSHKKKYMAVCK